MQTDPLAAARAAVLNPSLVDLHPALMQDAWAVLKEARGQPLRRLHLLRPAHLVEAEPAGTVQQLGAACARVTERVRALMAARQTGGDAA